MRIDPTGWAVGITGCFTDWLLTRDWRPTIVRFLPLVFAAIVGCLVFAGSRLDRNRLSTHYMKLADAEVANWETKWAPEAGDKKAAPVEAKTAEAKATQVAGAASAEATAAEGTTAAKAVETKIPRFAEVLFRRVQQLQSGDERSVFYVALTMAQRGSIQQSVALLDRIAPKDREGYLPAHAWLAEVQLQNLTAENYRVWAHHAKAAIGWDRTPVRLMATMAEIFYRAQDFDTAVRVLSSATERDPSLNLNLVRICLGQPRFNLTAESAIKKAEAHFREKLSSKPKDEAVRIQLAEALVFGSKLEEARQLIVEGCQIEDSEKLRSVLSEIYRVQFARTASLNSTGWSGNMEYLEKALELDPNNSMVYEEIAKLVRIGGTSPDDAMMKSLRQHLAEGKATSMTHVWIAELHLANNELAKAIPELEQVILRSPNAAQSLNNLAYCLSAVHPNRRQEALDYANRAVKEMPHTPDYHDTRGMILMHLGRPKEAIASFESAIEWDMKTLGNRLPNANFHWRLAEAYKQTGNDDMAAEHIRVANQLRENAKRLATMSFARVPDPGPPPAPPADNAK